MANKPLDEGVSGPPEQGLQALQAKWQKIAAKCRRDRAHETTQTYSALASKLTPHIAAQQALTAERDALRASGNNLAVAIRGVLATKTCTLSGEWAERLGREVDAWERAGDAT